MLALYSLIVIHVPELVIIYPIMGAVSNRWNIIACWSSSVITGCHSSLRTNAILGEISPLHITSKSLLLRLVPSTRLWSVTSGGFPPVLSLSSAKCASPPLGVSAVWDEGWFTSCVIELPFIRTSSWCTDNVIWNNYTANMSSVPLVNPDCYYWSLAPWGEVATQECVLW